MSFIHRVAGRTLQRYLSAFAVVGLTGPRQSGKSTFLQHTLPDYKYVTFDDYKNIAAMSDDPDGFFNQYPTKIIFDEVQYVPEIFNFIKLKVDQNRSLYGNYILTGSSQFKFLKHVTESLAGRIGLMSLLPLQYSEMPKALVTESIFRGSYPELVKRQYFEAHLWYGSYVETYLSKDLQALTNIGDLRDFRRFLQLLAARTTQLLDLSYYAKDIGVSVPTIKRWISVLEASYIIFIIPPYYENFGKRIIKTPKVYFYDTGLVSYFTGISSFDLYEQGPMAGALFENYVVSEVVKKELHQATQNEIYFFRTQDQTEIDLIVDRKNNRDFIEIKKTSSFKPKMTYALNKYAGENTRQFLLYNGERVKYKNVEIIPYGDYLEKIE